MFDIRIAKTPCHRAGKRVQFSARQIEHRNNLCIYRLLDECTNLRVIHRFADGIQPCLVGHRYQGGMCAVKNRHFPLFVRLNIINNQDIKWQFIQTQFSGQRFWPLDNKQIEVFGGGEETVFVPRTLAW